MNKQKSNINKIIIFIAGIIGVIILLFYIISSKNLPSFGEFMASSTDKISDDALKAASTSDSVSVNPSKFDESREMYAIKNTRAPKGVIQAEISDTQEKMELGLGNRVSLDQNSGMLFVFPSSQLQSFWMKDMLFPLDIVWMNADKQVVGVTPNLSPDSYPEAFDSPDEVQYVLELNAGTANRLGIATGTNLQF